MLQRILLAVLLASLGVACARPAAPVSEGPGAPVQTSEGLRDLVALAGRALDAGDLALAEARFERARDGAPDAASPRVGLARVALARGDLAAADRHAASALAREPGDAAAALVAAEVRIAQARRAEARVLLEAALESAPHDPVVHQRLADLTGPAPREPVADADAALAVARAHPYDPWAQLRAARRLARQGRRAEAVEVANRATWLADLDPASGFAAARLLPALDPAWRGRTQIPVHVVADESVRRHPGWRMRLRVLWRAASGALDPVLGVVFVPASIGGFSSAGTSDVLGDIQRRVPPGIGADGGVVAAFTERAPPRRRGSWRLGQATLLGRRMIVRLEPGETESRVLLHEILHLYGAVHIDPAIDSLMNPSGEDLGLDPANAHIVKLTRRRRFRPGTPETNVLPYVDLPALTNAYANALRIDLGFRQLGAIQARAARAQSRYVAAAKAREATALDPHLADVSHLLALLLLEQDRGAEAAGLLELESQLRGPATPRGRAAAREAAALRRSSGDAPPAP